MIYQIYTKLKISILALILTLPLTGVAQTDSIDNRGRQDSIDYVLSRQAEKITPWVTLTSRPYDITNGLLGRHLTIWPSHGRYYNYKGGGWSWQRPQLYGTIEDLFTQSIVLPYIIPMMENAGAYVYVPRERDWQEHEYIVDNDFVASGLTVQEGTYKWKTAPRRGFAIHQGNYQYGDHPFSEGTALCVPSVTSGKLTTATYSPDIEAAGRYAVYVSYQTVSNSVDDAEYIVVHQGRKTTFHVNQQMGSSTWVYLGTFYFDAHDTFNNYVLVTNKGHQQGRVVTTDAVRFGAGMGNCEREGKTSGLPKAMEGAVYWAQFAGAPRAVTCTKGPHDDYGDDLNCRSLMSNWLSYGSPYNPTEYGKDTKGSKYCDTMTIPEMAAQAYLDSIATLHLDSVGMANAQDKAKAIADSLLHIPVPIINVNHGEVLTGHVPIEMQLAFHSDAGFSPDFTSHTGTLSISTTDFNNHLLASGQERTESYDLASELLDGVTQDIMRTYGHWNKRELFDKNYSETRLPAQPSSILEMLSHENFADMRLGHDPNFKFTLARAIYKTVLRRLCKQHQMEPVIEPLTPSNFSAASLKGRVLTLSWAPTPDSLEESAMPTAYVVYTQMGDLGYDNGTVVKGNQHKVILRPDKIYRFKVAAINKGGESFPSEELVAMYRTGANKKALIVNAFHRLSSPEVILTDSLAGFDLNADIGLSYGKTPAWCGVQQVYERSKVGTVHETGTTDASLMGRFTAGNDFNYAFDHADAIAAHNDCHILSMSSEAITSQSLSPYALVDILLGNEKDDHHSLKPYKTFPITMQNALSDYASRGGSIIASGSYIASDMQSEEEQAFLSNVLHVTYGGVDRDSLAFRADSLSDIISLDSLPVSVYRHVNAKHYASVSSDILTPMEDGTPLMTYPSGQPAAIITPHTAAFGFPLECIKLRKDRRTLMSRILDKLIH